jgi:FtsZ-binding cell division protein ZapB
LLSQNNVHTERFRQLLGEIKDEVDELKVQISTLKKEKAQLKTELKKAREEEADIFSSLKEPDRMALKHQVKGLIAKIDEHLEDQP